MTQRKELTFSSLFRTFIKKVEFLKTPKIEVLRVDEFVYCLKGLSY